MNRRPTTPVPCRWIKKSATRILAAIGTMNGSNTSVAAFKPSTALRTEIAGVIIPSPKKSATPIVAST